MGYAYETTAWQDHVTEFDDRYTEVQNKDGTITHIPVEGEVIQQGTPQNAVNFNNMETGIFGATETAAALIAGYMRNARHIEQNEEDIEQLQESVTALKGEAGTVTLENTQAYPFNNSKTTVSLETDRETTDYCIHIDVLSANGSTGDIITTDKQLNGFKVEYTGSATEVQIRYIVTGGCANG